ncbi:MAG TPA: hypothetical protein VIB48_10180 [Acidimicrobiia bacterium]|jgi:hypothetical protein
MDHLATLVRAVVVNQHSSARREAEIAMLISGLGALAIIVGGVLGLGVFAGEDSEAPSGRSERISYIVGGFLLGIGFLVMILAIHGGFGSTTIH